MTPEVISMLRHVLPLLGLPLALLSALRADAAPPSSQPTSAPASASAPAPAPVPPPVIAPPVAVAPAAVRHEAESDAIGDGGMGEEDLAAKQNLIRRGGFSLNVGAMIQVQGAFYVGDQAAIANYDAADTEGFRIRRARFGLGGMLMRDVSYFLAVDLKDTVVAALGGDHGSELLDAEIRWTRFRFANLALGVSKIPFSGYALQSSSRLTLIERPLMTRLLAPEYRVGFSVSGKLAGLRYAAGLYNGSEGITSGNRMAGVAGVARLEYSLFDAPQSFVPSAFDLTLGGAYMIDEQPAVLMHRVSGTLDARYRRFRLFGEINWALSKPHDAPAGAPDAGQVARLGVAGELSAFVFRDLFQLAARYEYFKDNDQLPTFGKQQLISAGLNTYFYRDNLKLQVNYVRRDELEGPEVQNDIAFAQLQAMF
jgi:hypothetical protein